MPVYEALMIIRPLHPKETVAFVKKILAAVFELHPTFRVREIQNLGDRAMGKYVILAGTRYSAGRYLQMIYDGHPGVQDTIRNALKGEERKELLRYYIHRIKDEDYINHMYMKAMRHSSITGWDDKERDMTFLRDFNRFEKNAKP